MTSIFSFDFSFLSKIKGQYRINASLSKTTWFQVGGAAELLYKPYDLEDLISFLKYKPIDMPILTLGVGSNVIIRDGGIKGTVIKLGRPFNYYYCTPDSLIAGGSSMDMYVAEFAAENHISNLAFLSGIPGTIGGAVRMNAGAYGQEMKDVVKKVKALDSKGNIHILSKSDLHFSYRHLDIPEDWIFIEAEFFIEKSETSSIKEKMHFIKSQRESTQPIKERTGGSTFANPPTIKAWQLIDQNKLRGFRYQGAQISELHCNFMINQGHAKASDLEELGEIIRHIVFKNSGILLNWEIKRIGTKI